MPDKEKKIAVTGDGKRSYRIPLTWKVYGHVWVEAASVEEAINLAIGPETPLPDEQGIVDDSLELDADVPIEVHPGVEGLITPEELNARLKAGETLDEILHFQAGQECLIYKADIFQPGNKILYIPDISLNELQCDKVPSEEELQEIMDCCYTGDDFIEECSGDVVLAERLFYSCDWQHPSSALPELEDDEEDEDDEN